MSAVKSCRQVVRRETWSYPRVRCGGELATVRQRAAGLCRKHLAARTRAERARPAVRLVRMSADGAARVHLLLSRAEVNLLGRIGDAMAATSQDYYGSLAVEPAKANVRCDTEDCWHCGGPVPECRDCGLPPGRHGLDEVGLGSALAAALTEAACPAGPDLDCLDCDGKGLILFDDIPGHPGLRCLCVPEWWAPPSWQ